MNPAGFTSFTPSEVEGSKVEKSRGGLFPDNARPKDRAIC